MKDKRLEPEAMVEERTLTCIVCPKGCVLRLALINGDISAITGYRCERGEAYGRSEILHPMRILTTTVGVKGGEYPTVPVKSARAIPKELLFECMERIRGVTVVAPVRPGDVLITDICSTGTDIIATGFNPEK